MSILASPRQTTRMMVYAMICTLVVAFGAIGAVLAGNIAEQYSLMGLFLGSALGAFISVYESTIVGSIAGMLLGLLVGPLVFYFIDFETAYLTAFVLALLGAIMGEPMAAFWREADLDDSDSETEASDTSESDK
ncbi:MAG TPA: hypothetical protein PLK28_06750 [Candidatus Rifleibacterium sp.]|nr:hypothetical protein [Candidatus Rifleibacterium sp.]HPW60018.1 hypothetical protein [Candidatus Rifleibacterium sp.]